MLTSNYRTVLTTAIAVLAFSISGMAAAKDELPARTEDGLDLIESKNVDAVYWQEGATLEPYNKIMLLDCMVAFKKNWMRDQNRDRGMSTLNRIDSRDMERIKTDLAEAFNEEFTKVLTEGGYAVVTEPGDDVLLLRPAIINLDVTAPDIQSTTRSSTFTTSAGEMTLYMELYDSATSAKIGMVLDRKAARDSGHMMMSSSVSNRADANRMIRKWSDLLVAALDDAHGKEE